MIICNDTDLFGGRISIISTAAFCCQAETAGEGLSPWTVFHDLLEIGRDRSSKPVATLFHDAANGTGELQRRHQLLVEFINAVAHLDERLALASAIRLAAREFGPMGDWRWPDAPPVVFAPGGLPMPGWLGEFDLPARRETLAMRPALRAAWQYESHADSPLAD